MVDGELLRVQPRDSVGKPRVNAGIVNPSWSLAFRRDMITSSKIGIVIYEV